MDPFGGDFGDGLLDGLLIQAALGGIEEELGADKAGEGDDGEADNRRRAMTSARSSVDWASLRVRRMTTRGDEDLLLDAVEGVAVEVLGFGVLPCSPYEQGIETLDAETAGRNLRT